jgi:hypothetical protein
MQKLIAISKNGIKVNYDPLYSHAATHLEDTPNLKYLVIGKCDVVNVTKTDEIVYGVRKNREDDGLVPFVKNRQGDSCRYVAVHLVPQSNDSYTLSSAWIGTFGKDDEPFPQSKDANKRSIHFWNEHAFIYGSQEILPNTETTKKPW